jgi:predicted phosphoribosyltransferase
MNGLFRNRTQAGQLLAPKLRAYARRPDVTVLALPRGGLPVAWEVARKLHAPLDVLVVRKLGVPGQEELAMGALAGGGVEFRDSAIIEALSIPPEAITAAVQRERTELERREALYRGKRPFPALADRIVILVDDGIATGSTMRAAVRAVQSRHPRTVVVAAPVASTEAVATLQREGAEVVTVVTADHFFGIGEYYRDFRQLTDDAVRDILAQSADTQTSSKSAAA